MRLEGRRLIALFCLSSPIPHFFLNSSATTISKVHATQPRCAIRGTVLTHRFVFFFMWDRCSTSVWYNPYYSH